jgi:formylglycine-generating enzyme required for sulfatase activity
MKVLVYCLLVMSLLGSIVVAERGLSLSQASAPKPFTNSIGMKMARIEAGSFTMGEANQTPQSLKGPSYTEQGDWDEQPAHRVKISRPFYISETPVTIEQYRQFKQEYNDVDLFAPYVAGVSWEDAMQFCRWLSRKEGKEYRLPTEAEWEYAARAGTGALFWSGQEPPKADAANPWGLKDIAWGAPEWCYDWYGMYSDEDHPDVPATENKGPATRFMHFIGFRIVQAALPATSPAAVAKPFPLDCVLPSDAGSEQGPDKRKPYFKARPLLPIPPENDQGGGVEAVGLDPGVLAHIHSAGFTVAPNGDLLQISFSASARNTESEPNTTMVVTRLRRGARGYARCLL